MQEVFWQKQTQDKPLFPDLLWSRPERRNTAGKLLVIGGNLHAFAAPAEAFTRGQKAGAGTVRVMLPDAAKKIVGPILEHVEYAPSTPSGSFNQKALAEVLAATAWADGVLVAGDLGRNSETAILLEKVAQKYPGQLTLAKDAVDYITSAPEAFAHRPDTLLVLSFAQLQRLATAVGYTRAFTFNMDLLRLVDILHDFTQRYQLFIIVQHLEQIIVSAAGHVVTTTIPEAPETWRVKTAAYASVWWMQNPSKPLEALATALVAEHA
jgi:ADP-dependent NAD(P)H-hydrate dehydratase / NAD(P)H-hydrate epimerase